MNSPTKRKVDYFQQYMPGDICFGCGYDNAYGLQIRSHWQGEDCVCIWQPEAKHQGWPELTCGGIIATLIDCHCMASAMATAIKNENRALGTQPEYRFATGTLNIKYLKPTSIRFPLTLKARVVKIKQQRIYTLQCDLYADGLKTAEAEVIAFLVYRSDQSETIMKTFSLQ
ncbi:MAG: PaaI family thioesterase [Gammaproteobacteria bacterium]|nr:PaaI family thioesterase [Gammaproteobacteria bacterium]